MTLITLFRLVAPFLKEAFWGKQKIGTYLLENKLLSFLFLGVLLLTLTNYILFEQIDLQAKQLSKQTQLCETLKIKEANHQLLETLLTARVNAQANALSFCRKHEDEILKKLLTRECIK